MVLESVTLQHVLVLMVSRLTTQISVYLLVKTTENMMTLTMYVLANTAEHLTQQVFVCLGVKSSLNTQIMTKLLLHKTTQIGRLQTSLVTSFKQITQLLALAITHYISMKLVSAYQNVEQEHNTYIKIVLVRGIMPLTLLITAHHHALLMLLSLLLTIRAQNTNAPVLINGVSMVLVFVMKHVIQVNSIIILLYVLVHFNKISMTQITACQFVR